MTRHWQKIPRHSHHFLKPEYRAKERSRGLEFFHTTGQENDDACTCLICLGSKRLVVSRWGEVVRVKKIMDLFFFWNITPVSRLKVLCVAHQSTLTSLPLWIFFPLFYVIAHFAVLLWASIATDLFNFSWKPGSFHTNKVPHVLKSVTNGYCSSCCVWWVGSVKLL